MRMFSTTAFILCVCLAMPGLAGGNLSIRLAEATPEEKGVPPSFSDVAAALRQVGFADCRLVASVAVFLPAKNWTATLGEFSVKCSGPQNNLEVSVRQGGRELLNTTINLQTGKPFVLGSLSGRKSKMAMVFLVR